MSNHPKLFHDIIAAISTPLGEGGIGIVRISGDEAFGIMEKIFRFDNLKSKISDLKSHTLHHGFIVEPSSGERLDEVMVAVLRAPHTYTTEDMIEINAHGGILIVQRILQLVLKYGARLAEPGEFTKRAFLSGRMDLTQAEAVVDLIRSQTDLAERCALQQLTGELSKELKSISNQLLDVLAELEAHIDFPEEGLPEHTHQSMLIRIVESKNKINQLLQSAKFGKAIREGVRTTIVGKPNVGKSSLLNILLNEPRAIVTPHPGTTRDTITESVNISGIPFLFTDTAGWRETEDVVEQEGVRRTQTAISNSDLLILVLDSSNLLTEEDYLIMNAITQIIQNSGNDISVLLAFNKVDIPKKIKLDALQFYFDRLPAIPISAKTGKGIEQLKELLAAQVKKGTVSDSTSGLVVTNVRHAELLRKVILVLDQVTEELNKKIEPELVSMTLREAMHSLGEITGANITADLLDRIFSRFCIGK